MIRVIFLAQLREQLGIQSMDVVCDQAKTLNDLKKNILLKNPSWSAAFNSPNLLVAVNHAYVKSNTELKDGDEVAFFPPVTGG